jgi:predicted phosphate transport protein (TIGR00153 family)
MKWRKGLARWFRFENQGKKVLELIDDHIKIVMRIADQVQSISGPLKRLDWKTLDEIFGIIDVLESEADSVHRSAVTKICEGSYFGGIFGEILLLADKIDNMADSAKDALKVLIQRKPDEQLVRCMTSADDFDCFLSNCRDAVYALDYAIKGLSIDRKTAFERAHKIKEREEDADLCKSRLLQNLFGLCPSQDTLGIIQFQNFITIADDIADNAEDASDLIFVLITRGYG